MHSFPTIPPQWRAIAFDLYLAMGFHPVLAGGALRDLYAGKSELVKDLDFWPTWIGKAHRERAIQTLLDSGYTKTRACNISYKQVRISSRGIVAVDWLLDSDGQEVNLIWVDAGDTQAIIDGFDFGINQAGFECGNWTVTETFLQDHAEKTITLTRVTELPERLIERVRKMKQKYPEYSLKFALEGIEE